MKWKMVSFIAYLNLNQNIKAFLKEPVRQFPDTGVITEAPVTGQQLEPVGTLTMFHQIIPAAGCRNVIGALGHGALMGDLQVFVSCGNDHSVFLL